MSSIPLQLLIYVMPEPACILLPIILPVQDCFEVQVGLERKFDVIVQNLCDPQLTTVKDVLVSKSTITLQGGIMNQSPANATLVYKTFTWTPLASQIGAQELCFIAYTK